MPDNKERKIEKEKKNREGKHGLEVRVDTNSGLDDKSASALIPVPCPMTLEVKPICYLGLGSDKDFL